LDRADGFWRRITRAYDQRPAVFVGSLVAIGFLLRLAVTPFGAPVDLDVFAYMLKALEIDQGSWTPVRSHAIGWSVLLAPLLATVSDQSVFTVMNLTRVAGALVGSLIVVPFAVLVRETLDRRAQTLALVLCPVALLLVRVSVRAFAEPALTFVLVGGTAAAVAARRKAGAWVAAGILAGAGFWFHPTGLLNIAIVPSILFRALEPGRRLRYTGAAIALALVVAAPAGIQRARAFGSPFDFSFNNRFFAANDLEMWTPHVSTPSLGEYVATRPAVEIVNRLLVRGLGAELRTFSLDVLHLALVPLVLYGCWLARRDERLRPQVLALGLFLAAWVPIHDLYGNGRHLSVALPFALALSGAAVTRLSRLSKHADAWALAVAMVFWAGESAAAAVQRQLVLTGQSQDGLEWGRWTAEHVRGRLAISEGQELTMMFLPDAVIGGVDIFSMYAPQTGLTLVRPGEFPTIAEAFAWMKGAGVSHVVVDGMDAATKYFGPLVRGDPPPFLTEEYASPRGSRWPVRIFRVNWDRYGKAPRDSGPAVF
jgi:hypothetical protein